jgi:hypothetical protein
MVVIVSPRSSLLTHIYYLIPPISPSTLPTAALSPISGLYLPIYNSVHIPVLNRYPKVSFCQPTILRCQSKPEMFEPGPSASDSIMSKERDMPERLTIVYCKKSLADVSKKVTWALYLLHLILGRVPLLIMKHR